MTFDWTRAPTSEVAQSAVAMLDWRLTSGAVTIRLTEVEAYSGVGLDPASHAHRGPTPRTRVMFGPAGIAYVYFVFGVHWCLNVVVGDEGEAAAVLLRAGAVIDGLDDARQRRPGATDRDLARGPARLVRALGIDKSANGTSLLDGTGPILMTPPPAPLDPARVAAGPRVGVAAAHDIPWRFWLRDDPTVSPYRRHTAKPA